ncbi:hypothetical protein R4Z10_21655 (plasmid) [Niallia sp. XMNu-256]|uniref:hypothetical protein n=1 Tax=Niallia sp. XMNu-256 TaxID=3082444 RepID=UPI0030CE5201
MATFLSIEYVVEVPEKSIHHLLEQAAKKYGHQASITFEGEFISYDQLKDQVNRLAGARIRTGVIQCRIYSRKFINLNILGGK